MNSLKCSKARRAGLAVILTALYGSSTANAQIKRPAPASDQVLWYRSPTAIWTQALPVGNGRLGAMVFGGANAGVNNGDFESNAKNQDLLNGEQTRAQDEHLQLNESSLWQGSRADLLNPNAAEGFKQVRALLLASGGTDGAKIEQAQKIAEKTMLSTPRGMPGYTTLGDLYLRSLNQDHVTAYRRELNLDTGIARTTYTVNGVEFLREVFASAPDHILVMHLTASRPGALTFALTMDRPSDFATRPLDDRNLAMTQGATHQDATNFQGQVRVLTTGGTVKREGDALHIDAATEVTLLIAAATDFHGGPLKGGDPSAQCKAALDAAEARGFAKLEKAAVADERSLMDRVQLRLGADAPGLDALPTDERLKRVSAGGDDFGLQTLYFQYARYLLVGSSRPGGLPANLQGLWAGQMSNPWQSKWTININTEMNYWLAEAANLGELHEPLFDLLDMVRTPGTGTGVAVAKLYYGARGFVIHHNTDLWGDAHPIDGVPYGIWPMGGAWLTLHAWDHYTFSGDRKFLAERAWPLMKESSLFFLDYLADDGNGHLVTGPSLSPENTYRLADGKAYSLTMGPTMDIEIVRELFQRTIQASEVLNTESEFRSRVRAAMDRLPPFKIGKRGNLQEWQADYDDALPGHRHISHLWALFPGTQISPEHTPALAKAAQNTLERRLNEGGGQTGWSRAWVVNYWDHLHNGEKAYESMQVMLRQSTFPNLMDTHPPGLFQIDGNLGAANGMLEALVQSRWYPHYVEVDLLPARPTQWSDGSVAGVRVRGNAEIALQWAGSQLLESTWTAHQDETFQVRLPAGQHLKSSTVDGHKFIAHESASGVLELKASKGKTYKFAF